MQLKNHPDELWENGMNDYISHASNILVINILQLHHDTFFFHNMKSIFG